MRMEKVWADGGYNGKIGEWIKERLGWTLERVKPPRRWVRVAADEEPPPWVGFTVSVAEALGDRAHDRVDLTLPEDEPGL